MATVTELSGNEIYCLNAKNFRIGKSIFGNCVNTLGFSGKIESTLRGQPGIELQQLTALLQDGRAASYQHMLKAAENSSVIGVSSELVFHHGNLEFLTSGSQVFSNSLNPFSCAADGRQLFPLLDIGFTPLAFVFGNTVYSTAMTGGLIGRLKTSTQGEIKKISSVFNATRHATLDRITQQAKQHHANAVIGIDVQTWAFQGANEMLLTGTAAQHALFDSNDMITSTLRNEEMWSLAKMGYAPIKLLLKSAIFSLGFFGSISSAIKSIYLREIPELTSLLETARKTVLADLQQQAEVIHAEKVIDVRTLVYPLGNGLIEFFALGTAIKQVAGIKTQTEQLPFQVFS